jgi:hypothetical protein
MKYKISHVNFLLNDTYEYKLRRQQVYRKVTIF